MRTRSQCQVTAPVVDVELDASWVLFSHISSALNLDLPPPEDEGGGSVLLGFGTSEGLDDEVTMSFDDDRLRRAFSACCNAGELVRRTPASLELKTRG